MLKVRTLVIATSIALTAACSSSNDADKASAPAPTGSAPAPAATTASAAHENPLLTQSALPFQAPPFDKIVDADFQPALEEGMKQQLAEVEAIANAPEEATFENTIVALEKSGVLLKRAEMVFSTLTGANTNDTLQKVDEDESPRLAAHSDAIYLNDKLFKRVETLYEKRDSLKLDPESARLLEVTYKDFVHEGAKLSEADKTKLKDLNKEVSTLSTKFTNQLLAATKAGALVVDDKKALDGMSDGDINAAAEAAKDRKLDGKYVVTLQNTTQQPALQGMNDRDTREKLFKASWERAEHGDANDTREIITRIAQLRADSAKLLGFPNYAAWKLDDQMAKTPAAAEKFMERLAPAAVARATAESKDIQQVIDQEKGGFQVQAWDWDHYAEKVSKAKFDLDESQIKPYFELDNVLQNA